jgi:hypothetical protein
MAAPTIACTLTTADHAERRERWHRLGERGAGRVEQTETGLRLEFAATPAVESELQALAALERECCAFATWTVRRAGSQLTLDVEADGGALAAVHAMVQAFRATLPGAA